MVVSAVFAGSAWALVDGSEVSKQSFEFRRYSFDIYDHSLPVRIIIEDIDGFHFDVSPVFRVESSEAQPQTGIRRFTSKEKRVKQFDEKSIVSEPVVFLQGSFVYNALKSNEPRTYLSARG